MYGWKNLRPEDRDAILRNIGGGVDCAGPYHAELDLIDGCNARCFFCDFVPQHDGTVLPFERLLALLDQMPELRSVRLFGGGEPTLYPRFADLCRHLARREVVLEDLTTNGTVLHKRIDELADLRIDHLLLSLNYCDAGKHSRFMGLPRESFGRVLDNIHLMHERLVQQRRRQYTFIHIHFFLHRSTLRDLPRMMRLSRSLPVDLVTILTIGNIGNEEKLTARDHPRICDGILEILAEPAPPFGLEVDLTSVGLQGWCRKTLAVHRRMPAKAIYPNSSIAYCLTPWYNMTVMANGDAYGCCFLASNPGIAPLGNALRQEIGDIWQGAGFRRLREEIRAAMLRPGGHPPAKELRCTLPSCLEHDQCPLAHMMADGGFYRQLWNELELLRDAPPDGQHPPRGSNGAGQRGSPATLSPGTFALVPLPPVA